MADEAGWKLLPRDVFRTPSRLTLFSSFVGIGYQLIATTTLVLTLGSLGAHYYETFVIRCYFIISYLSFSFVFRRGSIISAFIAWYILCSFVGGFFSGSVHAKNNGGRWARAALITPVILPLIISLIVIVSNVSTKYHGALSYIPVATLVCEY